jgi:hypothetical protein
LPRYVAKIYLIIRTGFRRILVNNVILFSKNRLSMIGQFSDWTGKDEDEEDISVWEDNWDDDNVEDDFSMQLRY